MRFKAKSWSGEPEGGSGLRQKRRDKQGVWVFRCLGESADCFHQAVY
jgi:hypothetical protein